MVKAVRQLDSGMDVSKVKRLKEFEEENRKLKQILRNVIEKNYRARGPEGDLTIRSGLLSFIVHGKIF